MVTNNQEVPHIIARFDACPKRETAFLQMLKEHFADFLHEMSDHVVEMTDYVVIKLESTHFDQFFNRFIEQIRGQYRKLQIQLEYGEFVLWNVSFVPPMLREASEFHIRLQRDEPSTVTF